MSEILTEGHKSDLMCFFSSSKGSFFERREVEANRVLLLIKCPDNQHFDELVFRYAIFNLLYYHAYMLC